MTFLETDLEGAFIVELEPFEDERGFFARAFCAKEFEARGLCGRMVQANVSLSAARGTVRGLHYQIPPAGEAKLIRCIRGAVWDVIVDVRPGSPTYLGHVAVELSADNRRAIYAPAMFAHGNQALTDGAELLYLAGAYYAPDLERGIRFDDPAVGIGWPLPVSVVSEKDKGWRYLGSGGAR